VYFRMSKSDADLRGPWNQGERWDFVPVTQESGPVDGGDGLATVELSDADAPVLQQMAARTQSRPDGDPLTGAELGMGEGPALADGANGPAMPKK